LPAAVPPPPNDGNPASVDDALERLFRESSSKMSSDNNNDPNNYFTSDEASSSTTATTSPEFADSAFSLAVSDTASSAATTAAQIMWEPTWYNLSDQAIVAVRAFHDLAGVEYGWAIVGVTVLLRLALFPLMVTSQRTTSRMAHVQPELTLIKGRYEALGTPSRQDQLAFSKQMKALFDKYQVQPLKALLAPVVQLPLFMGMFFGLQKMPTIYHDELAAGGMFWFVDLTVPDPLYILPLASSATFLLLIELGKDQMMAQNAATGKLVINFFRVMSVAMVPVCISFEAAMLCYWTANNLLTLAQTQALKAPWVKQQFGIWDPPKPIPGLQPDSLTEAASKLIKRIQGQAVTEKQEMERHNQQVEVKKKGRSFQATMRNRLQQRGSGGSRGVTGKRSKTTTTATATTTQR
jgi:YidC/Oxa1 family membrane protein insertase